MKTRFADARRDFGRGLGAAVSSRAWCFWRTLS